MGAYQLATGIRGGLLFPTLDGDPWREHDFRNWRRRVFQDKETLAAVGLPPNAVPYDLRAASVTLQAWAGRTMLEVARNHGHSVEICDRHYAGIFDQLDPAERSDEDTAIRAARHKINSGRTLSDDLASDEPDGDSTPERFQATPGRAATASKTANCRQLLPSRRADSNR